MSSHVSVIFKPGRFRCCSFPLCFCKRIFNVLVESSERKHTDDGFVHLTILTRKLDLKMNVVSKCIWPADDQGFKIT